MSKNIVILLAGGTGERFGKKKPKQFLKIFKKTVIEYSLEKFLKCKKIDDIYIGCNEQYIEYLQKLTKKYNSKKIHIYSGGSSRIITCIKGYLLIKNKNTNIIFHDSARPIWKLEYLDKIIEALKTYEAAHLYSISRDILFDRDPEKNEINKVFNNKQVVLGQTPQGFKYSLLKKVYKLAENDPNLEKMENTELIQKYLPKTKISLIPGDQNNIKITYDFDYFLIKNILKNYD